MRRSTKKGIVKTVTLSAAIAAFSAGTIMSAAAAGLDAIQVMINGKAVNIKISDLVKNKEYLNAVVNAFQKGEELYIGELEDGKIATSTSLEISATVDPSDPDHGILSDDYDHDQYSPYEA